MKVLTMMPVLQCRVFVRRNLKSCQQKIHTSHCFPLNVAIRHSVIDIVVKRDENNR